MASPIYKESDYMANEYLSPTYDKFEKVRNYIINVRTINEKGE